MATSARVTIVGSSFVGVTTALALAAHKIPSTLLDTDAAKVDGIAKGKAPFREPGVDEALRRALKSKLIRATSDISQAFAGATHIFICVGTPPNPDGSQDLSFVRAVAKSVGEEVKRRRGRTPLTLIVKSTVVPGTTEGLVRAAVERASGKRAGRAFHLASNPEFLKEGSALADALKPDRIVIGGFDAASTRAVASLYTWAKCPIIATDPTTAEMVKYAANAFLATKISFANEFANLGAALGVDWYTVADAIGHDARIGRKFLNAGVGFGGSCFPKDLKAIASAARALGRPLTIAEAALDVNQRQPQEVTRMLEEEIGDLQGKRIALLGLAFKPDTDDVRESRAILIAEEAIEAGAEVVGYDPLVADQFARVLPLVYRGNFHRAGSLDEALKGADAAVIQNESREFRALAPARVKKLLKRPVVIDGRRILSPAAFRRAGIVYRGIGIGKA
jgi:UDPglucose 6-dehydrogenase